VTSLQNTFLKALDNWLNIEPDIDGAPDINVGKFALNSNPSLTRHLCELITPHDALMSYKTFQKLLLSHNEKPTKPDKDDPSFDPAGIKYSSETERRIAKAYRYKQAIKDYEKRHTRHQKIFARVIELTLTAIWIIVKTPFVATEKMIRKQLRMRFFLYHGPSRLAKRPEGVIVF